MLNLKFLQVFNDGKPTDASQADTYLQKVADNISKETANFLKSFSLSASLYAGGTIATATGAGQFTSLDPSLMSKPFKAGLDSKEDVNANIEKGFLMGLSTMCSAPNTVEEQCSGTTTAPSPITFKWVGTVIDKPLKNPGIKEALDNMSVISEEDKENPPPAQKMEQDRLMEMSNIFAKAVENYINAPLVTNMQGAGAIGVGTIKLTSPVITE